MNTFADLMNLLLCFFVLLFSMSTVDAEKFEKWWLPFRIHLVFFLMEDLRLEMGLISSGVNQLEMLDSYEKTKQILNLMRNQRKKMMWWKNIRNTLEESEKCLQQLEGNAIARYGIQDQVEVDFNTYGMSCSI